MSSEKITGEKEAYTDTKTGSSFWVPLVQLRGPAPLCCPSCFICYLVKSSLCSHFHLVISQALASLQLCFPTGELERIRMMMIAVLGISFSLNLILGLEFTYVIPQNIYMHLLTATEGLLSGNFRAPLTQEGGVTGLWVQAAASS